MKRGNQSRLNKLAKAKPKRVFVFWAPPGRTDDVNIADANQWLEGAGLPPNKQPMIFVNAKLTEMRVETIDDLGAMLAEIMEENTCRARRH